MSISNPFKVVLLFSQRIAGWSETFYVDAANPTIAFNRGRDLANIRSQMLGEGANLDYIRISQEGVKRLSTLTAVGPGTSYPMPRTVYASNADRIGAAALARVYDQVDQLSRPLTLRGGPDNLFDTLNPSNPDALAWTSYFDNDLRTLLTNGNWAIKSRFFPATPPTKAKIVSWSNIVDTLNSKALLDVAIAWQPGDVAIIGKGSTLKPSPGATRVIGYDSTTLFLTLKFSLPNNFVLTPPITIYKYSPVYGGINYINYDRATIRKTGRPFGGSRGRRPSIPR